MFGNQGLVQITVFKLKKIKHKKIKHKKLIFFITFYLHIKTQYYYITIHLLNQNE